MNTQNNAMKQQQLSSPLEMPAVIPGLENYPGCKGGAGVYQNIISHIPECDTLIIPFLGHCAIARNIRRPKLMILNDIDRRVYDCWKSALLLSGFILDYDGDVSLVSPPTIDDGTVLISVFKDPEDGSIIILSLGDGIYMMKSLDLDYGKVSIYCDPPYPINVRKKQTPIYRHESNPQMHLDLLSVSTELTANIIISTYNNNHYKSKLHTWSHHQFNAMTHGGVVIETIYYNFDIADVNLQDYRYLGKNYKDRERIRLKTQRHISKFRNLPVLERKAILNELQNEFS